MQEQVERFLRYLKEEKDYSDNTIAAYRNDLDQFVALIHQVTAGSVGSWADVDGQAIQAYGVFLEDKAYAASTIARKVASVKSFFSFLCVSSLLTLNPTAGLSAPKVDKQSPRILSTDEIKRLLARADTGRTAKALRDRALVELLYATGMRVSEVIALQLADLDLGQRFVFCAGRDGKQRHLSLPPRALDALSAFVHKGRDALLQDRVETALFVNQRGRPLTRQGLWLIVKSYAEAAGLGPDVTPHTMRHSCAAHRLAQGTKLQKVCELLGHANISTTQVYKDMIEPDSV